LGIGRARLGARDEPSDAHEREPRDKGEYGNAGDEAACVPEYVRGLVLDSGGARLLAGGLVVRRCRVPCGRGGRRP
jgi:hypothetical protein